MRTDGLDPEPDLRWEPLGRDAAPALLPRPKSADDLLMRYGFFFLSLLATGIGSGCGMRPAPSALPASSPLHGGILVPLPENQGFVELLNDKRERRGSAYLTTIVAYLLQADQKSAVTQQSKAVTVKLGPPPDAKTLTLRADPDPGDPAGSARFVSELGPFLLNQSGGEIQVVLDGKTLTAPFRGPR
jgi:hypothetical protein